MENVLLEKLAQKQAVIGVTGLGYVGLPLVLAFAENDLSTIGFDVDQSKIDALNAGTSYIEHIGTELVRRQFVERGRAVATADFARIAECDAVLICVPTPLTQHREPDMKYVVGTAESIGAHLRPGQLIVLESTTYPGTTEEVLTPILERVSGLKAGTDFLVAYSPEREDPSNKQFSTSTIPKVVGGSTEEAGIAAAALYDQIVCRTVPVSSCGVAEATKLMENIFRSVNIALVNELKTVFSEMGIDVWEVIRAAETKPFGYMPFYPGPGLGGHCIPIDPFYLTWKVREFGMSTRFIELAGEINTGMPEYVLKRTIRALNDRGKCPRNAKILLVGLAYKSNVDDYRESPTFVIWEKLLGEGAQVDYFDPHCPVIKSSRQHSQLAGISSKRFEELADADYDAAVIVTAHECVDHDALAGLVDVVIDTRNACQAAPNVVKA